MGKTMLLAPKITQGGVPGFLLWARRESPALYAAMARQIPEVASFDDALNVDGFAGITDVLSNVGGALSSAAGKIGTFVKNNALPILTAAVPVVVAKKQADVANAQYKLAMAQMTPMQTAITTQDGYAVSVPVRQTQGGVIRAIPSWVWMAGAGVAALGLVLMLRKRA